MNLRSLVFGGFISLLFGCVSYGGPCSYSLAKNGWVPTTHQPQHLMDEYNADDHWFTNESGDFFECPELTGKSVCAGVYQIFTKRDNGSFEEDHIACVE